MTADKAANEPTRLMILIASTRPGRVGLPVGQWVQERAEAYGQFTIDFADLAEINLPFLDEPAHPRLRQYIYQHTKDWSARVDAADAFIFVMPEYNYAMSAPLKNALDFLHQEWQYKPVGQVSYGGLSGGTRAVQMVKQVVTSLKMVPVNEAVNIAFVAKYLDDQKQFVANEQLEQSLQAMFKELTRWSAALKPLRLPEA